MRPPPGRAAESRAERTEPWAPDKPTVRPARPREPALDVHSGAMSAVLVLHGITMSGPSVLSHLGPIADALRDSGLELVAPNASRRIEAEELRGLLSWLRGAYERSGQIAEEVFREGTFWEGQGEHYGWFGSEDVDGAKHYNALEASLEAIRSATEGRDIVGIIGFSQGCAMAALTAGLAKKGHLPFGESLRFGVFFSGFKAVFDRPALNPWPVNDLPALLTWGRRDPVFPKESTVRTLAAEFSEPELLILDELSHTIPDDPETVSRVVEFVRRHLA